MRCILSFEFGGARQLAIRVIDLIHLIVRHITDQDLDYRIHKVFHILSSSIIICDQVTILVMGCYESPQNRTFMPWKLNKELTVDLSHVTEGRAKEMRLRYWEAVYET